eukprot:4737190-Amphidinium_carterae.1
MMSRLDGAMQMLSAVQDTSAYALLPCEQSWTAVGLNSMIRTSALLVEDGFNFVKRLPCDYTAIAL